MAILTRIRIIGLTLVVAITCNACPISAQLQSTPSNRISIPDCRVNLYHEINLACSKSGILSYLAMPGESRKQGELVAQIDAAEAKASFLIAEREASNDVDVRFARKAAELAQLKYDRAQAADRGVSGTVPEIEMRELRLSAEKALLQLQQANHNHEIAKINKSEKEATLQSFSLVAPFDAFILKTNKKPGEYVREGEVIADLVNDQTMLVEGFVDYRQIRHVSIGGRVIAQFENSDNAKVYNGQINFVGKKVDPISMKVRVSALVKNQNSELKDGLLLNMFILRDTRQITQK